MHMYVHTYMTGPAKRDNWAQTTRNRKTVNILGSAR